MKFAKDGDPSLMVWRVPASLLEEDRGDVQVFVLPLMSRPGGFLVAMPDQVLSSEILLDSMLQGESGIVGPSREFNAPMMAEEEIGSGVVDIEATATFLVVDLSENSLAQMREYDIVTDSTEAIIPFLETEPNALPKVNGILPQVVDWIETVALERLNFYSTREEQEEVPMRPPKTVPKKVGRPTVASLASQMASNTVAVEFGGSSSRKF